VFHDLGPALAVLLLAISTCAVWRRPWRPLICIDRHGRMLLAQLGTVLAVIGTIIGAIVLGQSPTSQDRVGIILVTVGVALHQVPAHPPTSSWRHGCGCSSGVAALRDHRACRVVLPGVLANEAVRADRGGGLQQAGCAARAQGVGLGPCRGGAAEAVSGRSARGSPRTR
jgi:hypothetical protein